MPSASMYFTCAGSFCPLVFAFSAGIRLSSTIVVFPDPETPVTTVSRPIGIRTSKGCTVCMVPFSNMEVVCKTGRILASY